MQTLSSPAVRDVRMGGIFWSRFHDVLKNTAADYQLDAIEGKLPDWKADFVRNFRIAAGMEQGDHYGIIFGDSDVHKVIEFVSNVIEATGRNEALEQRVDEIIEVIRRAQRPDGYLITHFINCDMDNRWKNLLECHELYMAGHMIEGAIAYAQATGKKTYLECALKFVEHIRSIFGKDKLPGYDGHPEIEKALIRLYRMTGDVKHLELAQYFIDQRGTEPFFFGVEWESNGGKSIWSGNPRPRPDRVSIGTGIQAHLPVREQTTAEGHAVRAVYLYTAMAELAAEINDQGLLDSCKTLYNNITQRRQSITGGVGATYSNEAFCCDYFLPNDCYSETCAAVGFLLFAHAMFSIEKDGQYMDAFERTLYNNGLSGMALDGTAYYYVNPIEASPQQWRQDGRKDHLKYNREKWLGCACCPPSVARLIASAGKYVYSCAENEVFVNLYADSSVTLQANGRLLSLTQHTEYPWEGDVLLDVKTDEPIEFALRLRIPGWCNDYSLTLNGEKLNLQPEKGYVSVLKTWHNDILRLHLEMPVVMMQAHPAISDTLGRVAVMRGPVVYCTEEIDNGARLHELALNADTQFKAEFDPSLLGGVVRIDASGWRANEEAWGTDLYAPRKGASYLPQNIRLVPYYTWNNRGEGEMRVWLRFN